MVILPHPPKVLGYLCISSLPTPLSMQFNALYYYLFCGTTECLCVRLVFLVWGFVENWSCFLIVFFFKQMNKLCPDS